MRYIDNEELRQWVLENLQRKLVLQAHELAVQTGCEVLLRLQDPEGSHTCKYYVTDGIKYDYANHGIRLAPGDLPMSGESGMPKKFVHDFTCQVTTEPPVYVPNGKRGPTHVDVARMAPVVHGNPFVVADSEGIVAGDELKRLHMDRLWAQQALTPTHREAACIPRDHGAEYPWNISSSLRHFFVQTSPPAEPPPPALPSHSTNPSIPAQNGEDHVLESLKHMHAQRFLRRTGEIQDYGLHSPKIPTRQPVPPAQKPDEDRVQFVVPTKDYSRESVEVALPKADHIATPPRSVANSVAVQEAESVQCVGATQQRYLCRICERTFRDLYNLVSHAKLFHSSIPELMFVCNTCKQTFEDASSLHEHLKTHGDLGFFAGAACQLKRPCHQARQRLVHQRRFPCPECGKMFSRFGFMQSHIERVHGTSHISAAIDTTALSKDTVISNEVSPAEPQSDNEVIEVASTSQKLYRCLDCEAQFDDPETFQQHIKAKHLGHGSDSSSAPPPFTGEPMAPMERRRAKSEDIVSPGKELGLFTCQECGKQFPRGKLLQNHVNCHHILGSVQPETKQQEPPLRSMADTTQAEAHQDRNHSRPNSPAPNMIGNNMTFKIEATENVNDLRSGCFMGAIDSVMSGNPPDLGAYQNGGGFMPRSDITQDSVEDGSAHVPEVTYNHDQRNRRKRFACDVCGKTYKYGFHMKEHRLTHAAVCPFVCRICGMGFFRQRQLRDHELRHTGAYPCRCEICGKGFPRTSELKRHLAFRHRRLDVFTRQNMTPSPPDDSHDTG